MKSKRIFIFSAILIVSFIVIIFFLNTQPRFVDYSAPEYTETSENLNNPYIGWYRIFGYRLSDDVPLNLSYIEKREYGPELILLEIDLQNYQNTPLSENALNGLNSLLSTCRLKGKQLIVRFVYDIEGDAANHEPDDISVILNHMTQTAQIINRYADCVYIIQGLFIGSWGEMHNTNFSNPEDLFTLAEHLNSVVDPSIFLAVRTPAQWRTITKSGSPLSSDNAFNGTLASRLGLFNDGMLGSATDLGTYAEGGTQNSQKLDREAEIAFQNRLCDYVPNGGEVVTDNPYNDYGESVRYLSDTHVSYLNSEHDRDVLNKWAARVCGEESSYEGLSGYDYIGCHLGYRYAVRSSELVFSQPWSETARLYVFIENVGFSSSYRPFDVTLVLRNTDTGEEYLLPVETDTRFWSAGEQIYIEIPIEIREYPKGKYSLFLKMNDPYAGLNVYFANESAHTAEGVSLGSLRIRQFSDF